MLNRPRFPPFQRLTGRFLRDSSSTMQLWRRRQGRREERFVDGPWYHICCIPGPVPSACMPLSYASSTMLLQQLTGAVTFGPRRKSSGVVIVIKHAYSSRYLQANNYSAMSDASDCPSPTLLILP